MDGFRILIVEDEVLIADLIGRYIQQKQHEVVGKAISYEEAAELYLQHRPDLVLIDIRLSGPKTGIDLAHFIRAHSAPPPFIYLTSQLDEHSLGLAKATFPAGYLSKPIQKGSLHATIEITMHRQAAAPKTAIIELFDGHQHFLVPINEVLYLEADHVYVLVYLIDQQKIVQRSSLKDVLEQLSTHQFVQTHRSYAVNIQRVQRWDQQQVYLQDTVIPISRSRREQVHQLLEKS